MTFTKTMTIALFCSIAAAGAAQAAVVVSYEDEAPGVENTTATFTYSAVEKFDSQPTQTFPAAISQTFSSGGAAITMDYTGKNGIQINSADQFGGAGGNGNYIVSFQNTPYTLNLSSTGLAGGINYFGYWLSALDAGNQALFYGANNQLLFTFNPQDVLNVLFQSPSLTKYFGNPNAAFSGQNSGEPYVFLNFFDNAGTFSKVVFQETSAYGGGYESDNHTVGHYLTMGQGTVIPLVESVQGAVPEPASWAMMLLGFACLGMALRSRHEDTLALAHA